VGTRDMGGKLSTAEMTEAIVSAISRRQEAGAGL
jgi:hypothetical protein